MCCSYICKDVKYVAEIGKQELFYEKWEVNRGIQEKLFFETVLLFCKK